MYEQCDRFVELNKTLYQKGTVWRVLPLLVLVTALLIELVRVSSVL